MRFVQRNSSWLMLFCGLLLLGAAAALDQPGWAETGARVLVYAIAAGSLGLLVGFGGLVSFGHAAFLLLGGYAVGILASSGYESAFVQWPVAIAVSAVAALAIGSLALRTVGVFFIMLTLAFSQMIYFVFTGLSGYGGDEGLPLFPRSQMVGPVDLGEPYTLFAVTLLCASLVFALLQRLVDSPFGLVLKGCRQNEARMRALGYPTFRYRLAAFVIAGAVCGLAGALLANVSGFISPEYGSWQRSGELLVMVILGGLGLVWGPVIGAVVLLLLEYGLSDATEHWPLALGIVLVLIPLFLPNGLGALIARQGGRDG